jgi:hypothetical protein
LDHLGRWKRWRKIFSTCFDAGKFREKYFGLLRTLENLVQNVVSGSVSGWDGMVNGLFVFGFFFGGIKVRLALLPAGKGEISGRLLDYFGAPPGGHRLVIIVCLLGGVTAILLAAIWCFRKGPRPGIIPACALGPGTMI